MRIAEQQGKSTARNRHPMHECIEKKPDPHARIRQVWKDDNEVSAAPA
jgi:hypothetical protein